MLSGITGRVVALLRPTRLHGLKNKQPVNIKKHIGKIPTWESQNDLLAGVNPYRSTPSQIARTGKPPKMNIYSYLHGQK